MPTLREYLSKNLSSIVARSKLGVKIRPIVHGALLPALGDRDLAELTPEAIQTFAEARRGEPKKDGTPRAPASVDLEVEALEQILAHAHSGKVPGVAASAGPRGGGTEGAIHGTAPGIRTRTKRGTQRGR